MPDEEDEDGDELWVEESEESEVLTTTWTGCGEFDLGGLAGLVVAMTVIGLVVRVVAELVRN